MVKTAWTQGHFNKFSLAAWVIATLLFPAPVHADQVFQQSQKTQVLGRELSGAFSSGTVAELQKVQTVANTKVLGSWQSLLEAAVGLLPDGEDSAYTQFYAFNKRVFSQSFYFSHEGLTSYTVGLAPAEVRVPVVLYPVGPLVLQVDGGVRFQAKATASVNPTIVVGDNSLTTIRLDLDAKGDAQAFAEGYAKLLVIRGGIGGLVDVLNGEADVGARFYVDGRAPEFADASGRVEFLDGRFYAFFDIFKLIKWKRLWNRDLFNWNGFCYSAGKLSCPQK